MSMSSFIQENPALAVGGGIIGVLLIGGLIMQKTSNPSSTPTSDLSGLKNGNLVYVPTSTSFTTKNIQKGTNIGNTTNTSTSTSTSTVTRNPPPPPPSPPPTGGKSLIWNSSATIGSSSKKVQGQNLTQLAAQVTRNLRAQGMPGSMSVGWHDLYAHSKAAVDAAMRAKHSEKGDNIARETFPGQSVHITIPTWG